MSDDRWTPTRRRCLATGAALAAAGTAGCVDLGGGGPLEVRDTERVGNDLRTVRVSVTVANTGEEAKRATMVVELSHTEAAGSISRERDLLLGAGVEGTYVVPFRPRFTGGDEPGWPREGEFQFDVHFEDVEPAEDFPGLVTPTPHEAIAGGGAWPSSRYDPRASAHNPATTAPETEPSVAWTADGVGHAFNGTGPVVADGTVYAGRPVKALDTDGGAEQWTHDGPARMSRLAAGGGVVAFGTTADFRAIDAADGSLRWTIPSPGGNWEQPATVADGTVYTAMDELYALDANSGDERWTSGVGSATTGPPPVAGGVVVAGGDPLRGLSVEDGSERWAAPQAGSVHAAAIAYDTVFAVSENRLVALDLAEGRTRWVVRDGFLEAPFAVGDGAVYAQSRPGYELVAFDAATGGVEWVCTGTDGVLGPPSSTDGMLVVQDERDTLYGIDADFGEVAWTRSITISRPGSVPVADGVCYVNETDGTLRALSADA